MTEAEQRAAVVAEALTWVGTPFRDQADIKGAGVDCAMLIRRVFIDTGIVPDIHDPRPYPPRIHLHRRDTKFIDGLTRYAKETDALKPGNILIYHVGLCFSHGAILISETDVVHASWEDREVTVWPVFDIRLTHTHRGKPMERKIFDPWA